jgi:type IV pilus assembly protein PilB
VVEAVDITRRLCDAVVETGLVTPGRLAEAQVAASSSGRHLGAVLSQAGLLTSQQAALVLERDLGIPRVDLSSYTPESEALSLVPAEYAMANNVLPLFEIDGVLTVALGDPFDVFALGALASEAGIDLEPVLAARADVQAAVAQYYGAGSKSPTGETGGGESGVPASAEDAIESEADPEADTAPTAVEFDVSAPIDLDVLAVADTARAAQLAVNILEHAAAAGADAVHVVPYKDDFFLAYRVAGTLEKVASAPLALEGPLVDAFRSLGHLPAATAPAAQLGRTGLRIAEADITLTISLLPTVSGQRMVLVLGHAESAVPTFASLGMSAAEAKAAEALLERGQGLLVFFAPAGHRVSDTYYAALSHAADAGRTIVSVERAIAHELPAVAQVLSDPAAATGAAGILSAALAQDTDIVALEGLSTPEEMRLLVEATVAGRVVVATVEAADIAHGVRHLFELGAEPHGLASALTIAVAQRTVRTNCQRCTVETKRARNDRPAWLPSDVAHKSGTGCLTCESTGYGEPVVLLETLAFTQALAALVATRPSASAIAAAAADAGMRSLLDAGIDAVRSGSVSVNELARALHLTSSGDRS